MSIQQEQRYYLKLKALYYFYEKRYTHTEIAKLLGISRVTLGRLLDEAHAEDMVKIEIVDTKNIKHLLEMEDALKTRFNLQDVKVVGCRPDELENVNLKLAAEGAKYFELLIRSGMRLGITWGRTLRSLINNLTPNSSITDLEVYTLIGGAFSEPDFQPNILAQELIQLYSGRTYILNAPYMCNSELLCSEIKKEPQIQQILESAKNLDLTLVGIGEEPTPESGAASYYHFDSDVVDSLISTGAVGDICGNFFDINGNLCNSIIRDKVVSIDIRELKHNGKVIGIGGGPKKIRSVIGALNGHYLDVLITDQNTAKAIIEATNTN